MTITASERLMIDELVRGVVNGAEGAADILGDYLDTITVPQGRVSGVEMSDFDPAPFVVIPPVPLESTQMAGQITGAWLGEQVRLRQLNDAWRFVQSTPPPPDAATATATVRANAPPPTLEAMEQLVNQFMNAVPEQDAARGVAAAVNLSNEELRNRILTDQVRRDAYDYEHELYLRPCESRAREIGTCEHREPERRAADLPGIPARVQRRPRFG